MRRQIIFLLLLTAIATSGMTCRHQKRTSIDETERVRSIALQEASQILEPTPIVVETTTAEGGTTSITAVPKSSTIYSLSDNTTASSEASVKEWISWQIGIPYSLCIAALLLSYVLWTKATRTGNIVDAAAAYVTNRLTQSNDPASREQWHGIQNIIDRR